MLLMKDSGTADKAREFRYGIPADVYRQWIRLHERSGLPQSQILHRLVRFLVSQDDVAQGMILGTITPSDDLIELLLKRLAKAHRSRPHQSHDSDEIGDVAPSIMPRSRR